MRIWHRNCFLDLDWVLKYGGLLAVKWFACLSLVGLAALLAPQQSHAGLLGQPITCTTSLPFALPCDVPSIVVGPSPVEFNIGNLSAGTAFFTVDVSDSSVTFTNATGLSQSFFGSVPLTLGDLFWSNDPLATIVGIANFSTSGTVGIDPTAVATAANSLSLDFAGGTNATWDVGGSVSFDIVASHVTTPEPTTLALLTMCLVGLGYARRRRA